MAVKSKKTAVAPKQLAKPGKPAPKKVVSKKQESEEEDDPFDEDLDDEEEDDIEMDSEGKAAPAKDTKKPVAAEKKPVATEKKPTATGLTKEAILQERDSRSVFMKRVRPNTTDAQMTEFFAGTAKVIRTRFVRSKGVAVVLLDKQEDVEKALNLAGRVLNGKEVRIERCKSQAGGPVRKPKKNKKQRAAAKKKGGAEKKNGAASTPDKKQKQKANGAPKVAKPGKQEGGPKKPDKPEGTPKKAGKPVAGTPAKGKAAGKPAKKGQESKGATTAAAPVTPSNKKNKVPQGNRAAVQGKKKGIAK
ncbi:nucleolin-like [Anopheles aquasalis]|uniref:nucleolin-like n=1 Tax=Anopheles aquasalis TaxID=42839 RepID=UPI00215AEF6D|nr:nucleolin-like [Anopheles aquasalis]